MLRFSLLACSIACSALLLLPTASAQVVTVEPGFQAAGQLQVPYDPNVGGTYATLSDGGIISFDGTSFERRAADGTLVTTYGVLGVPVFPSFVEVDENDTVALVGESATDTIFRIDLAAGTVTPIASLFFNFDAVIDATGSVAYVSAALGGFGAGNDLIEVDLASGATRPFAHLAGPSGPVALDANGFLYYATQDGNFLPGNTEILRWSPAQIASGVLLSELDAEVIAQGFDAASSLAFDPLSGNLFLSESLFSLPLNSIYQLTPDGETVDVIARTPNALSNLELRSMGGNPSATFSAWQPVGQRLTFQNTDFGNALAQRFALDPARPAATLSGIPAGPAQQTLTVIGAEPNSSVIFFVGFASDVVPAGLTLDLGYVAPFHTALPIDALVRRNLIAPTDATGTATLSYFDPGTLHGLLAFQAVILDELGLPAGSSTHVLN